MSKDKPVDETDDWWDDTPAFWSTTPPEDKDEYRILRASKEPVDGSPGFVIQWKVFETYDDKKERDKALKAFSKEHPKWRLKASEGNPYLERIGVGDAMPEEGINQ